MPTVQVVVISGSMGSGKTTVMAEASDLLSQSGIAHAAIDLDALAVGHVEQDASPGLACRNLAAVWQNYHSAGVRRVLIAEAVESRAGLDRIREAIPDSEMIVCRLTATLETMRQRVRAREPGMLQEKLVARVAELERNIDAVRLEHFEVANDDRSVTAVAHELLARAGWLRAAGSVDAGESAVVAGDGEQFAVHSNGGDWLIAWHAPTVVPDGSAHGANAFCVTADQEVVLVSGDAERWGWPGGRPEGHETWEQTLRREVMEEACAAVGHARLLGFCRALCLTGDEQGRVLVRSIWRAEVDLLPWQPRFEIRHRRVVPAAELLTHLWIEEGFEPIYRRALFEAGLL